MSILDKSIQYTLGILLIFLLQPLAWGGEGSAEGLQMVQAYAVSSDNPKLSESDSRAASDNVNQSATTNLSGTTSGQSAFGDGRAGFWIIGILINLSVLGWFLAWAIKEWRKKQDDR